MGRTLHFTVKTVNRKAFTEKELMTMYDVSMFYNSGEFKGVWTCENFFLDYYSYYPNWDRVPDRERNTAWEKLNGYYEDLRKEGKSHIEAVKDMLKKKMVCLYGGLDGKKSNETSGFCKTQGNEYNSMLVYLALCTISKRAPNLEIHLSDEGDYLLCDLYIRQGKVMPDFDSLRGSLDSWAKRQFIAHAPKEVKDIISDIPKEALSDMGLDNSYNDVSIRYVKEAIQKIKTVFLILTEQGLSGAELYIHNLKHSDIKKWFEPFLFSRAVNPDDFKKGKEDYTHIMSGFYGEYWGRNGNTDAEKESYKMTAMIQKMLPKDVKMEILPHIEK